MRVSILLQITADDGTAGNVEEVVAFEKATERVEDVGLSLAEGKALTAAVQRQVYRPRQKGGLGSTAAALNAAFLDGAMAAIPSCSGPFTEMYSSPALGCTAARA